MTVSFLKRPNVNFRFEIERAKRQILSGFHRSVMSGMGIEFKGLRPYDYSEDLSRVDWVASAKISEDLDELVSRNFYADKEISVVALLDLRESMRYLPRKEEHVSLLVWLFACSAFHPRSRDRFRLIGFSESEIYDSSWLGSEDGLEDYFCKILNGEDRPVGRSEEFSSYLRALTLRDAVVIFISDLCFSSEEKDFLLGLGAVENNITVLLIILNEWVGIKEYGYVIDMRDPRSGQLRQFDDLALKEMQRISRECLEKIRKMAEAIPALPIEVPLVSDPIEVIWHEFIQLGIEK